MKLRSARTLIAGTAAALPRLRHRRRPPTRRAGGNPGTPGSKIPAAPYLYLGWGNPPSATSVMQQTGIKAFTMAFMLSSGGCNPAWDGNRPLTGGVDQQTINAIRGAGGDIEIWYGAGSSTR